ncbi:TSC22 domain family protein 2 isoform X2 [Oncorhynchus kisutch]|uniref:TSC22 domain family member 2 n=1 Tax=Oncorhynchus kisutch TaxID=8019 RepID=A0A8C7MHZ6_ONCKI|nr:TSC22 domain family protein 2-like isoform X2 [Oncorhynchus kisutch]
MSKMPAKKKSCFQITSVTQAQVAASSATDDTESLDDPDESRTEDVSSEIFDMSRADYEPEVCDRSSSEETLNHVGEQEAPGVIPQVGQLPEMSGPPNDGFAIRKVGVAGSHVSQQTLGTGSSSGLPTISQSRLVQQPAPVTSGVATNVSVSTSQPVVTSSTPTSTTSTTSCSSRFRVIKLDHGTGEPFRRGRWTCTEFYEKDSEGNTVVNRTADNIRHANALDPSADRDSGLGLTGGSVVAPATLSGQGLDSIVDAAALSASHIHPVDTLLQQQQQQQLHHQNYNMGQPGTASANAFPTNKPVAVSVQQPVLVTIQPAAPQNLLVGFNGLPQTGIHIQKSHSVPPAAQTQPLAYPLQQQQPILQHLPLGHHLSNQPPGLPQNQADYYQHHQPVMEAVVSAGQTLSMTSLSVGQPMGQGPSPVMTPADGVPMQGQVGELAAAEGGVPLPLNQPAPGLMGAGIGGVGASMLLGRASTLQQPVCQYAPTGMPQPLGLHSMPPSAQNVPTAVVAVTTSIAGMPTTVPSASNTAAAVPTTMSNLTAFLLPGQQARNGGGVQNLLAAGFDQVEEGSRKVEGLAAAQPPAIAEKNLMKTPEGLHQADNPSVNSLFGIPIQMDWDEDSASGASVVAIDNKIEQAMDLVKSHLMYAVREEVEVLKEQIKELFERNSMLERENAVLKSLANSDQLSQLSVRPADTNSSCSTTPQQGVGQGQPQLQAPPQAQLQTQPPLQAQSQQLQTQPQVLLQLQSQQLQPLSQPQLQLDTSPPSQQPQPNFNFA